MRKLMLLILPLFFTIQLPAEALSLEECIQLALKNNPDIRISEKRTQIAEEDVLQSYNNILPNVGIGYSGSSTSQGPRTRYFEGIPFDTTGKSSSLQHGIGVSVKQNIYDGGQWWNSIKLAKNDLYGSRIERERMRQYVIKDVTAKFYTVLKAQELLKVYEKSLENSREQLKKSAEMYKIGQVAKKDLFKAQVNEGNDRLNIIAQKAVYKNALADLNQAMGRNPDEQIEVMEKEYIKPEPTALDFAIEKAFANNHELLVMQTAQTGSEMQYKIAKGSWFPSVSTSLNYSRGGEDFDLVYSKFDEAWNTSLNLNLSWSIFNGFQRKTAIQKNLLNYKIYDDHIAKKKIEIRNQIQSLIEKLNTYMEMIDIQELNIVSAQEDLRLAQEMYRLNSATLLEVLDAQMALTRARQQLISTKYDAKIAEAELAFLMGTL
ncbi:MAG TPA: TolC family protein [Candidatus Marinimicrobia bacterium]|nr:TolC family protein [Candidatus Neomarinimicrobiota bacterium]